jgi:hypothetical protein
MPPGTKQGGIFSMLAGNKSSPHRDRLARSDHHIAELKQSINEQLDLIDESKQAGRDAAEDEELLDALILILRAVMDHRLVILKRSTPRPGGKPPS